MFGFFSHTTDNLLSKISSIDGVKGQVLQKTRGDRYIWGIVVLMTLISVLVVYSATGSLAYKMNKGNNEIYLFKQILFMGIGILIIYILHQFNYMVFSRFVGLLLVIAVILLIYTLFFGAKINEGSRWIKLPIVNLTFQTSDFAKLILFVYISKMLSKKQDKIGNLRHAFLPIIIPVFIVCMLIMPANLSNALLTGATSLLLMFIGRIKLRHIFSAIGIALIPVAIIVGFAVLTHDIESNTAGAANAKILSEKIDSFGRLGTWVGRVRAFLYPSGDKIPYQVEQSKIAIANGGVLVGLGPGNSRQRNFLPQAYNDFIYSIIIEEYGIAGGAFVLFIYLLFLYRCIRIFRKCPFAFGAFLALGLSFYLVIQAIANMAVNVNLLPVTGVTLPLISMGGSSFLFTCAAIGIILSVARYVEQLEGKDPKIDVPSGSALFVDNGLKKTEK